MNRFAWMKSQNPSNCEDPGCKKCLPDDPTTWNHAQPLSSGRWDATGSWEEAVEKEQQYARAWAEGIPVNEVSDNLLAMAHDTNHFTLYERRALLERAAELVWQYSDLCD